LLSLLSWRLRYISAINVAVLWSATGQSSTGTCCDRSSVALTERSTRGYDTMNRVVAVDHPGTAVDLSYAYTPTGLLATATAGPNVTTYTYNRRGLPALIDLLRDDSPGDSMANAAVRSTKVSSERTHH
jgi:hypothetical protein